MTLERRLSASVRSVERTLPVSRDCSGRILPTSSSSSAGTPKRLKEDERRKLARYFGIPESVLGGPPHSEPRRRAGAGEAGPGPRLRRPGRLARTESGPTPISASTSAG